MAPTPRARRYPKKKIATRTTKHEKHRRAAKLRELDREREALLAKLGVTRTSFCEWSKAANDWAGKLIKRRWLGASDLAILREMILHRDGKFTDEQMHILTILYKNDPVALKAAFPKSYSLGWPAYTEREGKGHSLVDHAHVLAFPFASEQELLGCLSEADPWMLPDLVNHINQYQTRVRAPPVEGVDSSESENEDETKASKPSGKSRDPSGAGTTPTSGKETPLAQTLFSAASPKGRVMVNAEGVPVKDALTGPPPKKHVDFAGMVSPDVGPKTQWSSFQDLEDEIGYQQVLLQSAICRQEQLSLVTNPSSEQQVLFREVVAQKNVIAADLAVLKHQKKHWRGPVRKE